jgi:hypothetical protein
VGSSPDTPACDSHARWACTGGSGTAVPLRLNIS